MITLGQISIEMYNPDTDLEGSMKALREGFIPSESISIAVGLSNPEAIQGHKDLEKLAQANLSDGISIVARHLASNQIVGFAFNKIHSRPNPETPSFLKEFRNKHCHVQESRDIISFIEFADGKINLFDKYNTECFLECVLLATLPEFRGRKIAHYLVECTVELAREIAAGKYPETIAKELIGKIPKVVFAIWTSKYSARIGANLGFVPLDRFPVADLKRIGVPYPERIPPEHTEIVLAAVQI